ncbi:ABC transporter transmembrane domain-containing protein [Legionella tunisiensis]|uniref:ABC transporter transmembrane domain-containing protein n=1 Tax=Legionella tunisiensis TaxID=1034944 RepID=UPI0002F493F1
MLISLAIEFFSLLNPLFIQYVTDSVIISSNVNNLYVIAIAFSLLIFIQIFTEYIRGRMVIYLTMSLTENLSANLVKHLLKLPLEFLKKGIREIYNPNASPLIRFKEKLVQIY